MFASLNDTAYHAWAHAFGDDDKSKQRYRVVIAAGMVVLAIACLTNGLWFLAIVPAAVAAVKVLHLFTEGHGVMP